MPEITFAGEQFVVAPKIGLMPLMRFAVIAKSGADSTELDGLAAMYELIEQCIDADEWVRFQAAASRSRADGEDLMAVVKEVFTILSERPTSRPSDSSGGPEPTGPSSTAGSSSLVIARLEAQGRPDLALMVTQAQEQRTA